MILHIEHLQEIHRGKAWCGAAVVGPRVTGLDNFLYHSEQPNTAPICEGCIAAILARIGIAIARVKRDS